MFELIRAGERTWYIDAPSKMGVFELDGGDICLIDTGSRGDGEAVLPLLEERGWKLRAVYNTHAHVDHIGGNRYLHDAAGCPVYVPPLECFFAERPDIGVSILSGGAAQPELRSRFFSAEGCPSVPLSDADLPEGLEAVPLPGHSHGMCGFRTCDGVFFAADSLVGAEALDRYGITFLFDAGAYLESLEKVRAAEASLFVPSHADACADIAPLADRNTGAVRDAAGFITDFCREPAGFENVLAAVFRRYSLRMTPQQYVLIGCTVRAYLNMLGHTGVLETVCERDRLLWRAV
ncbi:MAG: MBL fold metallo-hydrolase [Oscillospiraceae bacterium]|nr:MBL fold metallo-hydrolase [Oscillospiraceae bacterium]